MPPEHRTLFFDIETGGKFANQSSILSIGYATEHEAPRVMYAAPQVGSRLFRWSEKNIWEKIQKLAPAQGQRIGTEKEAIQRFISVLKGHEGGILAGWNIGYVRRAQGRTVAAGFDIPFMLRRAEVHGLEEELSAALRKMKIRDIGMETAWKMARAVATHGDKLVKQGLLEEEMFEQAVGFVKQGRIMQDKFGIPAAQIPEYLSRMAIGKEGQILNRPARFAGWQLEMIHKMMGMGAFEAHEVAADVAATKRLGMAEIAIGEKEVKTWARMAMRNKLVASAVSGHREGYASLLAKAAEMEAKSPAYQGFAQEFEKAVEERVRASGGRMADIVSGRGLLEEATEIRASKISSDFARSGQVQAARAFDAGLEIFKRHKGKFAIGAAALALYALQPGSWFSGKDDEYNTIEGLPHGGLGQQMRRALTDFGSGYRGLPTELMGQKIDPRILEMRAEVIDDKEARRELQRELRRKEKEAQKELGQFEEGDLGDANLEEYEAINTRDKAIRKVNLDRFDIEVEDADTLVLRRKGLFSGKPISIRMAGIDAPEVAGHTGDPLEDVRLFQEQAGGREATLVLNDLLTQQDNLTLLVNSGKKTYGRYLGAIFGDQNKNLGISLIEGGAVQALPFGEAHEDLVLRRSAARAEKQAIDDEAGMWQYARYKALKLANDEIGRTITNNTFTRLDKMASNLNLGAFVSFIEDLGEQKRDLTIEEIKRAERMGRALRKTHGPVGNRFSAKDDAYNTIEAFRHEGMSGGRRRFLTHFGSGMRTIFSEMAAMFPSWGKKSLKRLYKGVSGEEVTRIFEKYMTKKNIRVLSGRKITGTAEIKTISADVTLLGREKGKDQLSKEIVYSHEEAIKQAQRLGLTREEAQHLQPVMFGHELSEVFHGTRQVTETARKQRAAQGFAGLIEAQTKTGSHVSGAVVADEFILAAAMGKESYKATRKFRLAELADIEKQITTFARGQKKAGLRLTAEDTQKIANLREYTRKTRKFIASFEQKQLHRFQSMKGYQPPPVLQTTRRAAPPPSTADDIPFAQADLVDDIPFASAELIDDIPMASASDVVEAGAKLTQKSVGTPSGFGATLSRANIGSDFKSPVNLKSAVNKAATMMKESGKIKKNIHAGVAPSINRARFHKKHIESMKRASANSKNAGSRHRQQAGRLVI